MGVIVQVVDTILFTTFLVIAIAAPLIDFQSIFPIQYYPKYLVNLKSWYNVEFGDYLVLEKPRFFIGFVWLELFLLWPLSVANLFGIVYRKRWFNTTCLIYGVSMATSMVTIIAELVFSGRASDKLKMMYFPFMGFAILAVLRALLASNVPTLAKRPVTVARKKRA